jgi:hypothetical protein
MGLQAPIYHALRPGKQAARDIGDVFSVERAKKVSHIAAASFPSDVREKIGHNEGSRAYDGKGRQPLDHPLFSPT